MVNAFAGSYKNLSHKLAPNAILNFVGDIRVDDESARIELNLKDAHNVTDLISNVAKEFTIRIPVNCSKLNLQKLKSYLDMTRGTTVVVLEVPSKENPGKIHRIRTNKRISLHKSLLEFIEDTLGSSWSFI